MKDSTCEPRGTDDIARRPDDSVKVYWHPGRTSIVVTCDARELAMRRMIRSINGLDEKGGR